MPISKEQAEEIKKQLFAQLDSSNQENKEAVKEYINKLDEEQLEQFLKQNKIDISESEEGKAKCVFCSIINKEMPSYILSEDEKAVAILDINPLSKGHTIILPKRHETIEKIPKSAFSLAQKISKRIKKKLKPEEIKIETSSFQGHAFINVIPLYKDIPVKKEKADEKELERLKKRLETKNRAKRKKIEQAITEEDISRLPKIRFRIP